MTGMELNAQIWRDIASIADDEALMKRLAKYLKRLTAAKPREFDPRKYCGPARDEMVKLYTHKIINVLGSDGKAL